MSLYKSFENLIFVFDGLGSDQDYILKHFSKFGSKFSFLSDPVMDAGESLCGQVHNYCFFQMYNKVKSVFFSVCLCFSELVPAFSR
jgi:hypothetical protein